MQMEGKKKRVGKKLGQNADWKKALVRLAPGKPLKIYKGINSDLW